MSYKSEKSNIKIEKNPLLLFDDKYKREKISFSTYNSFIKLQGGYFIFLLLIFWMLRFANSYSEIYITSWSKSRKEIEKNKTEKKEININE